MDKYPKKCFVFKYKKETVSLDLSVAFVKVVTSSDTVITFNDILMKSQNYSTLLEFRENSHDVVINWFDYVIIHNAIFIEESNCSTLLEFKENSNDLVINWFYHEITLNDILMKSQNLSTWI